MNSSEGPADLVRKGLHILKSIQLSSESDATELTCPIFFTFIEETPKDVAEKTPKVVLATKAEGHGEATNGAANGHSNGETKNGNSNGKQT